MLSNVALHWHVQARELQLLEYTSHTTQQCSVAFDPAYYNTVITQKALLYNDSPVATEFLVVLNAGARGSEHGVDMSEGLAMACTEGGLGQTRWKEQGDSLSSEVLFQVRPDKVSMQLEGSGSQRVLVMYMSKV